MLTKNLVRERMSETELRTLLRKQGIHQVSDIETAVLEADGTLSAVRVTEVG